MRLYLCWHRIRILLFLPLMSATCCLATAFLHDFILLTNRDARIVTLCLRASKRTVYLDMHTLVLIDNTPGYLCLLPADFCIQCVCERRTLFPGWSMKEAQSTIRNLLAAGFEAWARFNSTSATLNTGVQIRKLTHEYSFILLITWRCSEVCMYALWLSNLHPLRSSSTDGGSVLDILSNVAS